MIVLVGLGNVGDAYEDTKHNAGFWVLDEFARRNKIDFYPGKGDYVFCQLKRSKVLLVKPTTMMNKSGLAVKDVMEKWDLKPSNMLIVLDDVDLPLGSLRVRPGGGDGCHRGLENIIYNLQTNQFPRLRMGIAASDYMRPSEHYVLSPFNKANIDQVKTMVQQCADALQTLVVRGLDRAMNEFNS